MPLPITRRLLKAELDPLYGAEGSLRLQRRTAAGLVTVPQADIRVCNLSDDPAGPPGTWAHEPQPGDTHVAVDPVLGRVAFAAAPPAGEERLATFHYGSALAAGGGGYDRAGSLERDEQRRDRLGRREPRAEAELGRGRRRGRDRRQRAVHGAGDDHRQHAGAVRPGPRHGAPVGQPLPPVPLAHGSGAARPGSGHDARPRRPAPRRRAARHRGSRRHAAAQARPPALHARARPHARAGRRARRARRGEPDRAPPVRLGRARPLRRRPHRRGRGRRGEGERLGHRRVRAATRSRSAGARRPRAAACSRSRPPRSGRPATG